MDKTNKNHKTAMVLTDSIREKAREAVKNLDNQERECINGKCTLEITHAHGKLGKKVKSSDGFQIYSTLRLENNGEYIIFSEQNEDPS
jgi:hypothetical protein